MNRQINANPKWVLDERKKFRLAQRSARQDGRRDYPFLEEAVENGVLQTTAATKWPQSDLELSGLPALLKGENLKVEEFLVLAPLKAALGKVK